MVSLITKFERDAPSYNALKSKIDGFCDGVVKSLPPVSSVPWFYDCVRYVERRTLRWIIQSLNHRLPPVELRKNETDGSLTMNIVNTDLSDSRQKFARMCGLLHLTSFMPIWGISSVIPPFIFISCQIMAARAAYILLKGLFIVAAAAAVDVALSLPAGVGAIFAHVSTEHRFVSYVVGSFLNHQPLSVNLINDAFVTPLIDMGFPTWLGWLILMALVANATAQLAQPVRWFQLLLFISIPHYFSASSLKFTHPKQFAELNWVMDLFEEENENETEVEATDKVQDMDLGLVKVYLASEAAYTTKNFVNVSRNGLFASDDSECADVVRTTLNTVKKRAKLTDMDVGKVKSVSFTYLELLATTCYIRKNPSVVRCSVNPGARIMNIHPHGVIAIGYGILSTNPFMETHAVLSTLLYWAGTAAIGYLKLLGNPMPADRTTVTDIIRENKNMVIIPGGYHEASLSNPNHEYLYLKRRGGLFKRAIEFKIPMVPVYSINETSLYDNYSRHQYVTASLNPKTWREMRKRLNAEYPETAGPDGDTVTVSSRTHLKLTGRPELTSPPEADTSDQNNGDNGDKKQLATIPNKRIRPIRAVHWRFWTNDRTLPAVQFSGPHRFRFLLPYDCSKDGGLHVVVGPSVYPPSVTEQTQRSGSADSDISPVPSVLNDSASVVVSAQSASPASTNQSSPSPLVDDVGVQNENVLNTPNTEVLAAPSVEDEVTAAPVAIKSAVAEKPLSMRDAIEQYRSEYISVLTDLYSKEKRKAGDLTIL